MRTIKSPIRTAKKTALLLAALLYSMFTHAEATQSKPADHSKPAEQITAISLTQLNGQPTTLKTLTAGNAIYLKFWATWCKTCMQQMPHLQTAHTKHQGNVTVIAVNIGVEDSPQDIAAVQQRFGLTLPIVTDHTGQLAKAFDFVGTPYHVLITPNGQKVYAGYETDAELNAALTALSAAVTKTSAKAKNTAIEEASIELSQEPWPAELPRQGTQLWFFTSIWCHDYFKDNRPDLSKRCATQQRQLNQLKKAHPNLSVVGIVSPWWTDQTTFEQYANTFDDQYTLFFDQQRAMFDYFKVTHFATVLLVRDKKEITRWQALPEQKALVEVLKDYGAVH